MTDLQSHVGEAPAATAPRADLDAARRILRRITENLENTTGDLISLAGCLPGVPGAAAGLDSLAAVVLSDSGDEGTCPYCSVCGEWAGMFQGMEGWHHFRGDPAPGGLRELYDAGHPVAVAWCTPPARTVSPAGCERLLAALGDAIAFRGADTAQADGYRRLAAGLRAAYAVAITGDCLDGPASDGPEPQAPEPREAAR